MQDGNTNSESEATRRSVLNTLAGSSVALAGGIGSVSAASPGAYSEKQAKMRERFADEERVIDAIETNTPAIIGELRSDGKIPERSNPSVRGLVERSRVTVMVGEVDGAGVTHIHLTPTNLDIKLLHQVETGLTAAYSTTADSPRVYTTVESEDTVGTQSSCWKTGDTKCDQDVECWKDDFYPQRYDKKCCCCYSTERDCYWIEADCCQIE